MTYEELLKLKAYYIGMAKSPEKQPATPIHFVLQDKSQFIYTGMSKLEVVAKALISEIEKSK